MSSIKISNLGYAGSELFQDSETFLNELTDQDLGMLHGSGKRGIAVSNVTSAVTSVVSSAISIISQISISVGISLQSASVVTANY
jgi:hypothetical protein